MLVMNMLNSEVVLAIVSTNLIVGSCDCFQYHLLLPSSIHLSFFPPPPPSLCLCLSLSPLSLSSSPSLSIHTYSIVSWSNH